MTAATVIPAPLFPAFVYGLRAIVTMLTPHPRRLPVFCAIAARGPLFPLRRFAIPRWPG
jgi:hypothetical protein